MNPLHLLGAALILTMLTGLTCFGPARPGDQDQNGEDSGQDHDCHAPDLSVLDPLMDGTARWINYAPRHFDPTTGKFPTERQIRADLMQLYQAGYSGILTYDVEGTLEIIPRIAKEIGFSVVGLGVWDINDPAAVDRAVGCDRYVDIYIIGSEGIFQGGTRYTKQDLWRVTADVRARTCKPVTTAEPWDTLLANPEIFAMVDLVAANAYGWWGGAREPQAAVDLVVQHYRQLKHASGDKIVIIRETGFPTGGHPDASVAKQQQYFQLLEHTEIPFVYFEAYDQPWKHEIDSGYDIGPFWGLHDKDGNLKEAEPPPGNQPPVAHDAVLTTPFQREIDVLLDATDPEGKSLTYYVVSGPSNGTLSGTAPNLTYMPDAGFSGEDSFTFKVSNGELESNVAVVNITVEAAGRPKVEFTFVPPIGSFQHLEGITAYINYVTHRIVVYIKVDGQWWVKPYYDRPLTSIRWDGSWSCDITTGGKDQYATEIRAFVVAYDYDAPGNALPPENDYIACVRVTR